MKIWSCKIGEVDVSKLPEGADYPMRQAVEAVYKEITGEDAQFTLSGWNGQLSAVQRQIVEDAKPDLISLLDSSSSWGKIVACVVFDEAGYDPPRYDKYGERMAKIVYSWSISVEN